MVNTKLAELVPEGSKFGCLLLEDTDHFDPGDHVPLKLSSRAHLYPRLTLEIDNYLAEWIGQLRMEDVLEPSAAVVVVRPSDRPHVSDQENSELELQAEQGYRALLSCSSSFGGRKKFFRISGGCLDGQLSIRRWGDFSGSFSIATMPIDSDCRSVLLQVFEGVIDVESDAHAATLRYARLIRGYWAWQRALKSSGPDRLHHHCRALEALFKPKSGESRKRFQSRGGACATVGSMAINDVLREMYNLRSAVEHMHDWTEAEGFEKLSKPDANIKANERSWQAETLARFWYSRILSDPALRAHFESDQSIDSFWTMTPRSISSLVGTVSLDIPPEVAKQIQHLASR